METAPVPDPAAYDRRLKALALVSNLMTTQRDEHEIFRRLIELLSEELDSRRVSLMALDRATGVLQMRCAVGIPAEIVAVARTRLGEGIAGTCAQLGEPLFLDDPQRAKTRSDLEAFRPNGPLAAKRLPMSLTVPLKVKGEVVGVVNVTDRRGETPYTQADISFISALMGQAGYLLENANLLGHLQQLRAFNEGLIDSITAPLVVVDEALCIVGHNRAFADHFPAPEADQGRLIERAGLAGEAVVALREAMKRADGRPVNLAEWQLGDRIYEPSLSTFQHGACLRYLVFLHDATRRKQMEGRLQSAEKMAALGIVCAGVAHEINNPLAFVKSNLKSSGAYFQEVGALARAWSDLGEGLADPRAAELRAKARAIDLDFMLEDAGSLVRESLEGVERVERIVAGLKTFAHPDTAKVHRCDVRALLDSALVLTRGQWKYKMELVRHDDPELTDIWCLPGQLEQVFMNLVVNAAQATQERSCLTISCRNAPSGQANAGIEILFADTAGGIPPGLVGRVFDPFFTTKDIGEGTGMGLAISYNIVEAHGGRITVKSDAGIGSTFRVWLPGGDTRPQVVAQTSTYRL